VEHRQGIDMIGGMQLKAYAKINWDLHILGRRPDGFHELDSVFVNVNFYDTLTFEASPDFRLSCDDPSLPVDETNLVTKSARALAKAAGIACTGHIHLQKTIPMGGGMGGGSSDAATALVGLNRLWKLEWTIDQLSQIAANIGSDVAFFLHGGWCRCRGRGEIVERLSGQESWPVIRLLLIFPQIHVSTPQVYRSLKYAQWDGKTGLRGLTDIVASLESDFKRSVKGTTEVGLQLRNDLTDAARIVEPRLQRLQTALQEKSPGRWLMSGSGATHFVVSAGPDDEIQLREWLKDSVDPDLRVLTATTFTPVIF
jgi:4-diphosphocytidyl-2-C-methyl-D-erythritol kinase